jgi:hypothetical protein
MSKYSLDHGELPGSHISNFSNNTTKKPTNITVKSTLSQYNILSRGDIKLLKKIFDKNDFENAIKGTVDISKSKGENRLPKKKHFILFQDKFLYYKVILLRVLHLFFFKSEA